MKRAELLERVDALRVWQKGEERAPHKPLLLLLALGEMSRGELSISYEVCERKLGELLRDFGPPRTPAPELPFWHLQRDGLWEVRADTPIPLGKNGKRPTKQSLRSLHAEGHFRADVRTLLQRDPALVREIGRRLLDAHFPETVHEDVLAATGLSLDTQTVTRKRRDPAFRHRVLQTYGYCCAVCDLDLRMGNVTLALEAAHIRWHQAGGPDQEDNGLALCSLHHKVFDLGAFTVAAPGTVLVSEQVNGSGPLDEVLLRHHGKPLRAPVRGEHRPHREHLAWHEREVFRRRARPLESA